MRRRLIIIAAALVLIVGVSLTIIILVNRSPRLQNVVNSLANQSANTNTFIKNTNTGPVVTVTPDRTAITFVVRNFTEVFGSGSTENGGSNLVVAQQYGTPSYNTYLNGEVAKQRAAPATVYRGTVTRALAFDFLKLNETSATVLVSTQYSVTTNTTTDEQTRDLLVDLVKVNGDWKVNAAAWK